MRRATYTASRGESTPWILGATIGN